MAQTLEQALKRGTDLVARYGGEEFGIILPNTSREGARVIAENLETALNQMPLSHPDSPFARVTVSIGISSMIPQPGQELAMLITEADRALYHAKRAGRNQICVASEGELIGR